VERSFHAFGMAVIKKSSFALGLFLSAPLFAQNIDSEMPLRNEVNWKHVEGVGAKIDKCHLDETRSLKCQSDRPLLNVSCRLVLGVRWRTLKVGFKNDIFACESVKDSLALSHEFEVVVTATDQSKTKWIVRSLSAEQQDKLLRYELVARDQGSEAISLSRARFNVIMATGLGPYTGAGPEALFRSQAWLFGGAYQYNMGSERKFADMNLKVGRKLFDYGWFETNALFTIGRSGAVSYGTSMRTVYLGPEFESELGYGIIGILARVSAHWPQKEGFKEKLSGSAGLRLGPIFSHYELDLLGGYASEYWSNTGGSWWESKGPFVRLSATWTQSKL
jgi:hypothetical protein